MWKYSDTKRSPPVKSSALGELAAPRLHRQRCQVQAGRAILLFARSGRRSHRRSAQRPPPPAATRLHVHPAGGRGPRLRSPSPAPASARRAGSGLPACDRNLGARRDVPKEFGEHVQTSRIGDSVQIVERQNERALTCGERAANTGDTRRPGGSALGPERHRKRQARRARLANRGHDRPQQHERVVVSAVE